jgi:ABC-type molybdate transport system permease subunit
MRAFAAALLQGPDWRDRPSAGPAWLAAPLLLVCGATLAAAAYGLASIGQAPLSVLVLHTLPLAALAAVASLVLAAPACLAGPLLPWLLPLWCMPVAGIAGWALLPVPKSGPAMIAGTTLLLLPVAVPYLAGAWAGIPAEAIATAATLGASPAGALRRVLLRPALARLPRAFLLLCALGLSLVATLQRGGAWPGESGVSVALTRTGP